jgi:hypothetical protein
MHAGVAGSGIAGSQRDWYPLIYRENRNSSFSLCSYRRDMNSPDLGAAKGKIMSVYATVGAIDSVKSNVMAKSRAEVDAFYDAAMANGGTDEGAPGLRPHYGPNWYSAYVRDPAGNKIAVVYDG